MRTHCCGNFETNQCCNDCPITAQILPQPIPVATPAWHDAPTCVGLWVRRSEYLVDALHLDGAAVSFLRQDKTTKHLMWYGPIPEDKQS